MAIQKTTYLNEVLIRFGPSGVIGAHAVDAELVTDDSSGEVYKHELLPPREIAGQDLNGLLEPTVVSLIAEVKRLTTLVEDQAEQISAMAYQADVA